MENKEIIQRLNRIEEQMKEMKELIINIDVDSCLSLEDEALLEEALEDHKKGKTIPLEVLKEELGD